MLTTFVIALREGLEASLIVGIIAAFLSRQGRPTRCARCGWASAWPSRCASPWPSCCGSSTTSFPSASRRASRPIVALVAVAMVTYMIVWMTEHARDLKGQLQEQAAGALAQGSATALVAMAFLAVLREGFETSVFLLAAFNDATDPVPAGLGVVLGLVAAVALGFGIYRGGVRLNLSRFFRVTGVGPRARGRGARRLLAAHGGRGGLGRGRPGQALDLSAIIRPGTVWESLITGILGIHRAADGDRGRGLAALRHPDAGDRPRARRRAPARARDGGRRRRRGRPGRPARRHARRQQGDERSARQQRLRRADRQRGDHRRRAARRRR